MDDNRLNKSDDNQADFLKTSLDGPSHASTIDLSADLLEEKPAQGAPTTALATPHDAVLAELHGRRTTVDMETKQILAADNPLPGGERLNNPYRAGSTDLAELSATSESLFDPFTGTLIGDLLPTEAEQDPGAKAEEDLWTHLSKILRLQSDIAEMHVKMEGIDLKKPGAAPGKSKGGGIDRRPSTSRAREWSESAADEGVDEEADEEVEKNRKREEEFSRLTDKFTGRKDAIDEIMKNLDELSSALTTFHGLRTPIIDFQNTSKSASANTSTSIPSPVRSVSQPPAITIPPSTSPSAPPVVLSSGTQKRQPLSTVLLPVDGARPAIVDSPDSMKAPLLDDQAR